MDNKYATERSFLLARAKWGVVRAAFIALSSWRPIKNPADGYSIVIGCPVSLISILAANLRVLQAQDLTNCRAIICVMDRARGVLPDGFEDELRARFSGLPSIRFAYYSPLLDTLLRRLAYPNAYAWCSWQIGLSLVETRHAIIHDYDAFALDPTLLETRYQHALATHAKWLGQRWYVGNGVVEADRLTTTFEMVLDAESLRRDHRPIDLFNRIRRYKGRRVELDTTLEAQAQSGGCHSLDMPEDSLVHPSQVVHQHTELTLKRNYIPPPRNRLPFIPYLLDVGGDDSVLANAMNELEATNSFTLSSRRVDLSGTDPDHVRFLSNQAERLDTALYGRPRPLVSAYFQAVLGAIDRARDAATSRRDSPTTCPVRTDASAV